MKCPKCHFISKDEAPKVCSHCASYLVPSNSEKNGESQLTLEVDTECGKELKGEDALPLAMDTGERLPDGNKDKIKKKNRKKKKKKDQHLLSEELGSLSLSHSALPSLSSLPSLGLMDNKTALQESQVREDGLTQTLIDCSDVQTGSNQVSSPLGVESHSNSHFGVESEEGGTKEKVISGIGAPVEKMEVDIHPESSQSVRRLEGVNEKENHSPVDLVKTLGPVSTEGKDIELPKVKDATWGSFPELTSCKVKDTDPLHTDPSQKVPLPESKVDIPNQRKRKETSKPQTSASPPREAKIKSTDQVKGSGKEVKNKNQESKKQLANEPATRKVETQEKPTNQMKRIEEKDKNKPKDMKKQEEPPASCADSASCLESSKEQRSQTANEKELKTRALNLGEGIRVYFHAILSRDFSFDPVRDKVSIRGGEGLCENAWSSCVCEMNCTKELGEHGFLIEGNMMISKKQVLKSIPYKYYIVHGSNQQYEFIYKNPSKSGQHVNRCLFINKSYQESGEWHQYDDIICMKPHNSVMTKLKDMFFHDNTKTVVNGKFIAAGIMLENIFSILSTWNTINLNNFFSQFCQFYFVVKKPMVYEDQSKEWTSLGYGEKEVKQVLWKHLKSLFLGENNDDSFWPVKSKLKMGIIILMLAENYTFPALKEDLISLCKLLCLDSISRTDLCQELKDFIQTNLNLKNCLINMCQKCIEKEILCWVWILPVLHHFVEFVDQRKDIQIQPQNTWAGLESLPFYQFQKKHVAKRLLECMKEKKHLLLLDQNLFRSWFCLIPLSSLIDYLANSVEYLTNFPTSILDCLQGIYYRLQEIIISYRNHEVLENLFKKLLSLLNENEGKIQVDMLKSYFTLCLKFHETVCKKTEMLKFYGLPVLSAEIISVMIRLTFLGNPKDKLNNENGNIISVKELFQETLTTTKNWFQSVLKEGLLKQYDPSLSYNDEPMAWSEFVKVSFPNEDLSEEWKKSLLSEMEGRIKQEKPVHQIILYCRYYDDLKKVDSCIAKSFETCAIEAVSPICQSQTSVLALLSTHNLRKFGTLVSAVITKSWPEKDGKKVDDLDEVLQHLFTWPDIVHIFNLYGSDEKILEEITPDAKKLMAIADSVFIKVISDLQSGRVLVRHMDLIEEHKKQILHLWKLKNNNLSPQEKEFDLEEVLTWRIHELQSLKREQKFVESFLKLCRKVKELIKVDFGDIEKKHLEDVSGKKMDETVTVRLSRFPAVCEYKTYYNLSPWLWEMVKKVYSLKDSHVYQVFWEEQAQSLVENGDNDNSEMPILNLENVCDMLFSPCHIRFHKLYEDLKSGKVTFAEVHSVFKNFVNKYDDLTKELKIMCRLDPNDKQDWIIKRVEQIKEYHHLHLAVDSAKIICKVKEDLGLTGDFSVLQILLSFTDEFNAANEKLDRISNQLIQAKQLLQDIDETRRQCLEEISLRKEFIGWVKEALEDINELKVFVDLASISAGENDMDVDRVACFHDAVQGYASILYKLEVWAGFREFMEQLKELWKALENDQHLPKKLRDSARHLEWLKTVKDSHGSVELSSLSLATAINSKGIYIIRPPKDGQKVTLDTVLHLNLPERYEDREEIRHYSLEELKELLNKLMLMSGKKDQNHVEVDKFSEVFSNIQRLARAFINLYTAGNMLFRSWTATVYCSPKSQICIEMNFYLETIGQLTGDGEVTTVLAALHKQMEFFLGNWKRFMIEKRSKYFYLNYYTAEQLVYLCIELKKPKPDEAALAMLSFIKKNCTRYDILKILRSSDGVPSRHHRNQAHLNELQLELSSEPELIGKVKVVWEFYMRCMNALLPNCLNIDSLGLCLANLSEMGGGPTERHLPQGLQAAQPNLITCPLSDVLCVALAIYMETPCQPLPSYDEVLLCTSLTTYEEVSLFLHRCLVLGYQGHKVYSLLYADELSYEVSCQVEELFQNLCVQCHRDDYQLVIICNSEREHCYIPSAFSQYKVLVTPQQSLMDIQKYLHSHYQVSHDTHSAASVFKDRVCVKVVTSKRAGVGKSLYVKRLHSKLKYENSEEEIPLKTIRLIEPQVNESKVLASLLPFLNVKYQKNPMLIHLDITSSVQTGIWEFLFKLLILQYLMDTNGKMWPRHKCHLYVIEILEVISTVPKRPSKLNTYGQQFSFLDIFPKVTCRPPKEVMCTSLPLVSSLSEMEPRMDREEFCSESFQRPFQYLKRFYQRQNLDMFQYKPGSIEGTPEECLQQLLIHCGIMDPSWSELQNFSRFLNYQLRDCEASLFCNPTFTGDTLRGFKNFVVRFMILMARDFATPSLHISDQSSERQVFIMDGVSEEDIAPFCLRKRWESEPHPYIFFNDDHTSMTFIGFHLQPNQNGGIDAVSHLDGKIIERNIMTQELYDGLLHQRVPFNINFDQLDRNKKLEILCMVLGIQWPLDPDETYELTIDNILKILAIEMRFRCGIPVIIMGETGCGKTRLIKFLSDLRRGGIDAENMKLVKVHGGTSATTIHSKIREAEAIALVNRTQHQFDTILFFDEANTTEAINCIKEVLCDNTVDGEPLFEDSGLHIIAACNPYRKHTEEMIKRLETAGLGYHVKADETVEKLGSIPLRQLVYRVHALPASMVPLVWDFGQLNNMAERLYIQQIAQRLVHSMGITQDDIDIITEILSTSQNYMRKRDNECSFVSLRDVERCVEVFRWFYGHSSLLLKKLDVFLQESNVNKNSFERNPVLWSLVLAIGVCYHASLEEKEAYWEVICELFEGPYSDIKTVLDEISQIQDLFLSGVPLRKTIAKNLALKENIFMMVICIELRIPLFLVGKPGSSKSLAKTIVADAMQGQSAYSELFKELKQVHLVSFQCSPHSTPQGIIGTFKQCARFQQGKNLQEYVSVVVLDEVGLAEDSPKMPLKALHPLLEDGCIDDDPLPHKKVGFIGISNWALDPAKMNRGIFVSRGAPNKKELIESAKGICCSDTLIQDKIKDYFASFAEAYEVVCDTQDKEFFGLRDYYSLIKMVFAMAKASNEEPTPQEIAQAVLRNFSGKDNIDALETFTAKLPEARCSEEVSTLRLIWQNIYGDSQTNQQADVECRYLLVLTKNYVALQILQQAFFSENQQPEIIFGSSFPKDQEYTQICRNINRIKICMETGKIVVLLNLQNLYESLYDALNQYYVYLGGQKYVDLGLGTHRVKCRVHPDFRLIVIEEKEVVYKHFPIPLINRLEKHYLDINTVLEKWQKNIVEELQTWVENFINVNADQSFAKHSYSPSDVFIGYHSDTCASVVLQVSSNLRQQELTNEVYAMVSDKAKYMLLNCATPDAVVRLSSSKLGSFAAKSLAQKYYRSQQHDSFVDFLKDHLQRKASGCSTIFTEITTFSRLLTSHDSELLETELQGLAQKPRILRLQQFDTEYSFLKEIRNCLDIAAGNKILIIQTDFEDDPKSAQLIASAKYSAVNEINNWLLGEGHIFVYFITKLSRMESGTSYVGFHGGLWHSVHIDDLRRPTIMVSDMTILQNVSISQLFKPEDRYESMEVEPEAEANNEEDIEMETDTISSGEMDVENYEVEKEISEMEKAKEHTQVLDTTSLLRSCVQSAMGMLKDQNDAFKRATRRVEILLSLLTEDGDMKTSFLQIFKARLFSLLKKQEENYFYNVKQWVVREASNQNALQEAGTFRHTLWKRVQNAVIPLLAAVVSFIDRDCNLELLVCPTSPPWVKALWMFVFQDLKFLNIPLMLNNTSLKAEMSSIMIQNYMKLSEHVSNDVPFSWRIKDYLDELWMQAQYITDTEGLSEKFVDIFQQTNLGKFLASLNKEEQQMLLQSYLKDFLLLTMNVSTRDELQFLQIALWSCIGQLKAESEDSEEGLCLPWVHLAYQHFRNRIHNFARILAIHPSVLETLKQGKNNFDLDGSEMVLDVYAALACAEILKNYVLKPNPQAWLQMVKNLHMPFEFLCTESYMQSCGAMCRTVLTQIKIQWNQIFSMALFVEHVLLETKAQLPELQNVVTEYVSLLGKCLQDNSDIKTQRPFAAVMAVLCECKNKASQICIKYGLKPCPVCLGDPKEPVCLPCDHVYCQKCITTWLIPGQMRCPFCVTDLPDEFSIVVSQEHSDAIAKHIQFRQMCNNFFMDLVSTMCFKDNTPPDKEVIEDLLSLLFVHKRLLKDDPLISGQSEYTKSLSPFDDVVDKTPVIRSVILKLLLKYSFHDVKEYIQHYLSQLEQKPFLDEDKTELYTLFINCLEDSIYEKASAFSEKDGLKYLRDEGHFLGSYSPLLQNDREAVNESSVEYLQDMARIRLCLDRASDFLFELHEAVEVAEEKQRYLQQVKRFCLQAGNDWYRVYLVRKLVNQHGMEFVQSLCKQDHQSQWVFPKEIIDQLRDQSGQIDRYLVCGDNYKDLRDAVGRAILRCDPKCVMTVLKKCKSSDTQQAVYLLLAIFQELTVSYRSNNANIHPTPEQCEAANMFIKEAKALSSPALKEMAKSLVTNDCPFLTVDSNDSGQKSTVTELVVHAKAILLCGQNPVLEPLKNLAFNPASMQNSFLPTMPEDLLAQAKNWQGLETVHWYLCPNGHPCSVGECGAPMERSRCIDCGARIGGERHQAVQGFNVVRDNVDRTQSGHVLGNPDDRGVMVVSDREISPVVFILLRLLTHMAMLLGTAQNAQALGKIIKPTVWNPERFLQQHIQKDLEQLMKSLGRSADETANVVHLVLCCLLKEPHSHPGHWPIGFDATLSSKERRNSWEKVVAAMIMLELTCLDKTLLEANIRISQDERISSNPVVKIMYGDPATFLSHLPTRSIVHCSKIWNYRKKITVEYLQHVVEQNDGKDTVPILYRFLQKERELRLVKFLPEILALQRDLVKRFQNVSDVEYNTIRGFLGSHYYSEGLRRSFQKQIEVFLSTWNKLRRSLCTSGEIKLPKEYCNVDLSLESEFEILLPRRRGLGLCSTALVSYLIALHNDLVYTVRKYTNESSSYSINASEVTDLHVISYEVERDLTPLILSNCQYSVEKGRETLQQFDLEKIQRQVTSRFLQGKPLLTLQGLPTLVYRHDRNYEHIFMDIKNKMPQKSLPNSFISTISGQLQSHSDACEALRVAEITLGFLSTAGGDPEMHLNVYTQDILHMHSQTDTVLKALNRCQLKHTIALWQFLSAHKSEQLLRLRKDPFGEISAAYKDDLSAENAKLLNTFLNQGGLDTFLMELHEMILLKLKHTQIEGENFNPKWSLKETLVSYMETKESEIPPEIESQFPEEILLSHCIAVWKAAASLKQDRRLA